MILGELLKTEGFDNFEEKEIIRHILWGIFEWEVQKRIYRINREGIVALEKSINSVFEKFIKPRYKVRATILDHSDDDAAWGVAMMERKIDFKLIKE